MAVTRPLPHKLCNCFFDDRQGPFDLVFRYNERGSETDNVLMRWFSLIYGKVVSARSSLSSKRMLRLPASPYPSSASTSPRPYAHSLLFGQRRWHLEGLSLESPV